MIEQYAPVIWDIFKKSGIEGFLRWLIDEGLKLDKRVFLRPYHLAMCHAILGEKEKAFARLEEIIEMKSDYIMILKTDPGLDNLRSDPRFSHLLGKVGLK